LLFAICITSSQLKSQVINCKPGWNPGVITTAEINSEGPGYCFETVYYCWKDDENHQRLVTINSIEFSGNCDLLKIHSPFLWEDAYFNILKKEANLYMGSEYLDVPLCSEGGEIMVWSYKPSCFYYSVSTMDQTLMYLNPCSEDNEFLCGIHYKVCWDNSSGLRLIFIRLEESTVGECPNAVPPPRVISSDALIPGYTSECYFNCLDQFPKK
jgi:hypothetical protein